MIGGSSAMNAMGFVRGSRFDFEQWEREGATGWGYDKVLPYFKKLENAKLTDYGNCGNTFQQCILSIISKRICFRKRLNQSCSLNLANFLFESFTPNLCYNVPGESKP